MNCRGGLSLLALVAPLVLAGCTGATVFAPMPQSGFVVPNANVAALDHVSATVSRIYFLPFQVPDIPSAAMQREAYTKALQQSGGDLIIDGDFSVKTKLFPLLFLTVVTAEGTVEGTAARITQVGTAQLH